jgi:hypothetical protein
MSKETARGERGVLAGEGGSGGGGGVGEAGVGGGGAGGGRGRAGGRGGRIEGTNVAALMDDYHQVLYSLCTMYYTLCTMYYVLCTMHYALCTMCYVLGAMYYTLYTIQYYTVLYSTLTHPCTILYDLHQAATSLLQEFRVCALSVCCGGNHVHAIAYAPSAIEEMVS